MTTERQSRAVSLEERFWRKVKVGPGKACWEWVAFRDKGGYGRIRQGRRGQNVLYAHRYVYELSFGPIPDGLHIDHLCRNRGCVNPDHLEAVEPAENIRRGVSPSNLLHQKGTCLRGHEVNAENTYFRKGTGERMCRICRRERRRDANAL